MGFLQQFATQSTVLSGFAGIEHGFFGRQGGVSQGVFQSLNAGITSLDNSDHVQQNRNRIAQALGAQHLVSLKQVHATQVVYVDDAMPGKMVHEGDAMITNCRGIALGVLTADCAPVLYYAHDINWVGAAHAGWTGALLGVNEALIDALILQGAKLHNIYAAIGPCISQQSYEVDEKFRARVINESQIASVQCFTEGQRAAHYQFDLPGYIRLRLQAKGVSNIDDLALDTYVDEPRYFSYRRSCHQGQNEKYGRQISAIMLR